MSEMVNGQELNFDRAETTDTSIYFAAVSEVQAFLDSVDFYEMPEELRLQRADKLVNSLNDRCPLVGKWVLARGLARIPDDDDDLRSYDQPDIIDLGETISIDYEAGTRVVILKAAWAQYYEIEHVVLTDGLAKRHLLVHRLLFDEYDDNDNDELVKSYNELYLQLWHEGGSIADCDSVDRAVISSRYPESVQPIDPNKLVDASRALVEIQRSTAFRRKTARAQVKQLDRLMTDIGLINIGLIGSETTIKFRLAEPVYYYQSVGYDQIALRAKLQKVRVDEAQPYVYGECLGVVRMEDLFGSGQRIINDSSLFDKGAGLCLVLDPYYRGSDTHEWMMTDDGSQSHEQNLIYVPLSDGRQIEDIIVEQSSLTDGY